MFPGIGASRLFRVNFEATLGLGTRIEIVDFQLKGPVVYGIILLEAIVTYSRLRVCNFFIRLLTPVVGQV